eukprot:2371596-Rhodomonas_salina.2
MKAGQLRVPGSGFRVPGLGSRVSGLPALDRLVLLHRHVRRRRHVLLPPSAGRARQPEREARVRGGWGRAGTQMDNRRKGPGIE